MMTKEEAMNLVKQVLPCLNIDKKIREAFETLIPELKESKDERIRKGLIEALKTSKTVGELKFAIPYPEREECIAYLEKQKDASKAIEAVDRIDKYIDEHLANAHDMKDSNPDKKYYRGWDDALGKMAGILQDVYSGEKQKESLRDFIDNFPYSAEQEEQKPVEVKDPFSNANFVRGYESGYADAKREQQPAEWSEDDEEVMEDLYNFVISDFIQDHIHETRWKPWKTTLERNRQNRLKSLRPVSKESLQPHWKPSEEQMDRLFSIVAALRKDYCDDMADFLADLRNDLKRLGLEEEPEYYQHFDPDC